jgi:plasmid stabilization system protein ParE
MSIRIEILPEASQQLEHLDDWWRAHRPAAPSLVIEELERILGVLADTPEIGIPYRRGGMRHLRRLRLCRTPYQIYYQYLPGSDVVSIVAAWSAVRRRRPPINTR